MTNGTPRVSIGLPVFNGAKFIEEALRSIAAQTFGDFELIICDNASEDSTEAICRLWGESDPRIRYHRNESNLGASRNFNRAFEMSSGEYFKWAAHDDVLQPEFLSRCVKVLDEDPSVVLCHTGVRLIDEEGNIIGEPEVELQGTSSDRPHRRFADLTRFDHWCFEAFGLIRSSALSRSHLIAGYSGSDRNLLVELGLLGRFHRVPEALFLSRDHSERSVRRLPALQGRQAWFDPGRSGAMVFPHWRSYLEFFKAVGQAPLSKRERVRCYLELVPWLWRSWNWVRMLLDLLVVIDPRFWQLFLKARQAKSRVASLFHAR